MHPLLLTASTPAHALARLSAEEVAVTQLQGRCARRVCYAPKTTPAGERAYGHFAMDADALAAALGRQLAPAEPAAAPSADLTLHRWLRDHNDTDDTDEPTTALPPAWSGLDHLVEELLSAQHARVFCTCCNRNVPPRAIRLERSLRPAAGVQFRYLCAEGHVLLGLHAAHGIAAPLQRAA